MKAFWALIGVAVVAWCGSTLINKVPASALDPLTPANSALIQSQVASNMADVGVKKSQETENYAESNVSQAQADKIQQELRRQREMDDGIAANVGARVVMGRGNTDAEQLGTGIFSAGAIGLMLLGALSIVAVCVLLSKLTNTTVTRV